MPRPHTKSRSCILSSYNLPLFYTVSAFFFYLFTYFFILRLEASISAPDILSISVFPSEAPEYLSPKELLDRFRFLCKGKSNPDMEICREFNRITRDGKDMKQYSGLLNDAIASIISVKQASDIDSFLSGVQGSLFTDEISGLDDFELICFLVIK